jgi:hypothetical protein
MTPALPKRLGVMRLAARRLPLVGAALCQLRAGRLMIIYGRLVIIYG